MKSKILLSTLFVVSLVLSACASATPTAVPATVIPVTGFTATPVPTTSAMPVVPATQAPIATPTSPAVVNVGQNASLGSFLVNGSGWTLYVFANDTQATSSSAAVSACTSTCTTIWLPLLTNGTPTAGTGVTASMLGTLTRSDGSVQVTYNGWPLYTYTKDMAAGDTNGQAFKSLWYAVTPAGTTDMGSMPAAGATMPPVATPTY
jgi:predicted lipoprotein with Yx(FWY)xxD motif